MTTGPVATPGWSKTLVRAKSKACTPGPSEPSTGRTHSNSLSYFLQPGPQTPKALQYMANSGVGSASSLLGFERWELEASKYIMSRALVGQGERLLGSGAPKPGWAQSLVSRHWF